MSDDGSGMGDAVQALPASVAEAELTTSEPEEPTPTETSEDVEETATITATDDTSSRQVLETMSLLLPALSNTTTDDVEDRTGQPMQGSSTESETVVVHSDSTIEYGCPANGTWDHSVVLQGSLTGSTADGAGCYARYTFTGDSVTAFGATGPKAGVFGCSTASNIWKAVGWWNAYGTSPTFAAYQGSCTIAGLGFGTHTITITNNPNDPKLLYFTGFRYTTNQSAITWAAPEWGACCGGYTFPKDAITTIEPGSGSTEGSSATATSGCPSASASRGSSPVDDTDWKTIWGVALAALALVALSSLLIGCMCCRKRSQPADDALSSLAKEADPERRPL